MNKTAPIRPTDMPQNRLMSRQTTKKKRRLRPSTVIARVLIVFAVTLLLIVIALYGVMLILTHGPSESAKRLFVMSVKETSAGGFLADMCLSRDEVDAILAEKAAAVDRMQNTEQNTDLITIGGDKNDDKTPSDGSSDNSTDGSNTDNTSTAEIVAQGDGIRVERVSGGTYNGVMMIVDDPKRVFVGIPDAYGEDKKGLSLKRLIEKYGAIGGTNAGGFADPGGKGNGGGPKGAVIKDGELKYGSMNGSYSMVGIDGDGILHVGTMSPKSALDAGVRDAVSFGPALIINGTPCNSGGSLSGGFNPRTAIGQRSDGAMLMLVINGRSIGSLGATLDDLVSVMLDYGAVNASNLDGGASSLMMYDGGTMNNSAYVYGERVLPNAILVK